MIVAIDASNLSAGGGVTHLKELLENFKPDHLGIKKIIVFSSSKTLKQIKQKDWLVLITHPLINKSLFHIILWQQLHLKKMLVKYNCDLLFCPAGTYIGKFKPYIAMAQNMLIFEKKESARFGLSYPRLKLFALNVVQKYSFKRSNGIIFPSDYAKDYINKLVPIAGIPNKTISHGINEDFKNFPKKQNEISGYNLNHPFKLLYVSTVSIYKHQWNLVEAVYILREKGYPIELTLIGSGFQPALKILKQSIDKFDPAHNFIKYLGPIPYNKIEANYKEADAFIFASTCESFGIILVEAMASGLPIACSNKSVMPEILKDAGFYFDPESVKSICDAIEEMINSPLERRAKAEQAFEYAKDYTWEKCADETFKFISEVAGNKS